MDAKPTESIQQALFIHSDVVVAVKPGYVLVPPDIASHVAELGHALESQKLGELRVSPMPVYSVQGGEAALAFELHRGKQRELDTTRLELTNFVMLLNDYAQKIKANAACVPRQTLERIVNSKAVRAILLAAAHLVAMGCRIAVPSKKGEIELQPPPLEDFATPAEPEPKDLESAELTGCQLIREAGCIFSLNYEYSLKCPKASHHWAIHVFAERRVFTGRIIKSGGAWTIDAESPCTFSLRAKSATNSQDAAIELPVGAKAQSVIGDDVPASVKPKQKKGK